MNKVRWQAVRLLWIGLAVALLGSGLWLVAPDLHEESDAVVEVGFHAGPDHCAHHLLIPSRWTGTDSGGRSLR